MMTALFSLTLRILLAALVSGQARLDRPLHFQSTDDMLQYDDGSAQWIIWSGLYRGTWFNVADFGLWGPYNTSCNEFWFYHHSSYPWDVSSFYCELYNGGQSGPVTQLGQTSVTALHYQPSYAEYNPFITCEMNFWVLVNTGWSLGGWPSILADNTPQTADHSFFSDDFLLWEPLILSGSTANDFFIRTGYGEFLTTDSWGSIKTLF